jgi:hypothetical protein
LRDDIAITGRVDKKANLLPVDEDGLKLKVEACFFSHIKYLIVPKGQVGVCQSVVDQLTVEHSLPESSNLKSEISNPSRSSFDIVGISNLEELFYNRKFTDSRQITVVKQTARKVWKLRRPIAAAVLVVLLLIIGKMWYGPIDKNPITYSADGETLFIKNKYGEVVDKIKVGHNTVREINHRISQNLCNIVNLFDIDGDKFNEVVYAQAYQDASDNVSRVFCKDIIKDSICWSMDITRKLKFPQHPYVSSEIFSIINISAGEYDNDGRPELYINAAHYNYFPNLLIKVDAIRGEKLAEYINIGQCQEMELADIDSDGVSEVILGGVNNSYDMAAVAILDSRFIEGHSPISKNYDIEDFKPGLEKAYLLIPRTIVGNSFRYEYRHNNIKDILIINSESLISIWIADCPLPTNNKKTAEFSVQLNFDLKVKEIGTDNNYDILARQLYAEGKITRPVDHIYFEEYKKEILYWDGDKFVNYPTLNKRYLEAVAKLEPEK